jgi:ribA/ribD-fused uncharacterized protein
MNPLKDIKGFSGDRAFLSNFCSREFMMPTDMDLYGVFDGKPFLAKTAEHAFQAQKATNAEDFKRILDQPTPSDAKFMARNIRLREGWDEIKIAVMRRVLEYKFKDLDLQQWLLDTGDEELIEENWWMDDFWGVDDIHGLGGQNWLGKLLMEIRSMLKEEYDGYKTS